MISQEAKNFDQKTKEAMSKADVQISTELYYNKKTLHKRLHKEILRDEEICKLMETAVNNITNWANTFDKYESKQIRLRAFIENNDLNSLIERTMCYVLQIDEGKELITSIAGRLAPQIKGLSTYKDQVITAGEIITLMCDEDLFDMQHENYTYVSEETGEEFTVSSWFIYNPWELTEATTLHIERARYLPPMVVHPRKLTKNIDTGYLTKTPEPVLLGKHTHHEGELCLDSLNRAASIPLSLNVNMLKNITEEMLIDEDMQAAFKAHPKRKKQQDTFIKDSYHVFAYLVKNGNRFWMEYRPDNRGRQYSQGYHCNLQGNSFRKSIIELADKEKVTGDFK